MGIDSSIYEDEEQENEQFDIQEFLKKWGIVIAVTAAFIVFRGTQELLTIGTYDLYYFLFIIGFMLAKSSWIYMKHKSPKLICDPLFTTTDGEGKKFGSNYTVFSAGQIRYGWLHNCKDGTIIVPNSAVVSLGYNVALLCAVQKIEEDEIPFSIREQVLADTDFKPPYYRGYASTVMMRKYSEIGLLIKENKELNTLAAQLERTMKRRAFNSEFAVDFATRLEKLKMGQKAKDWLNKDLKG